MSWRNPLTWFSPTAPVTNMATDRDPGPVGGPADPQTVGAFTPEGSKLSPIPVNETTIFNSAAIWAAVSLVSEALGSTPAHVYRERKSGTLDKATDHELEDVLQNVATDHPSNRVLTRTNDGAMVPIVYKSAAQAHLCVGGNSYSEIVRNGRGQCTQLYLLQPRCVDVGENRYGQPTYRVFDQPQFDTDAVYRSEKLSGRSEDFHFTEMLHLKGFSLDGLVGKSPLRCARESLGLNLLQDKYATQQLLRGRPLGFLKTLRQLGTKGLKRVTSQWSEMVEGVENMRKVGVLHGGMEWQNVGASNADMEFMNQRKFSIYEVSRWFRVPPHMLGELTDAKYSDVEQLMLEFMLYTMLPWVVRWEQELNLKLFTYKEQFNHYVFFDLEHWMRGDSKAKAESNQIKLRSGVLTPDEWRKEEHKNPLDGGIGRVPLIMGSQYDSLKRVVEGTSKLQGGAQQNASSEPSTEAST